MVASRLRRPGPGGRRPWTDTGDGPRVALVAPVALHDPRNCQMSSAERPNSARALSPQTKSHGLIACTSAAASGSAGSAPPRHVRRDTARAAHARDSRPAGWAHMLAARIMARVTVSHPSVPRTARTHPPALRHAP